MDINDRGTMKWTSIMLPEHVQMLEDVMNEDELKEKPIIDEQMKMENYALLQEALEFDYKVRVKYYANHDYHYSDDHVLLIDESNGIIFMEELNIKFDDIINVSLF